MVAKAPPDQAGVRLALSPTLRPFLASPGAIRKVAASVIGEAAGPVRAILFDEDRPYELGSFFFFFFFFFFFMTWWRSRVLARGPLRAGLLHVAPPFDLLAGMVTLRVHLDPVPETNAPLLIAPGSRRLGQFPSRLFNNAGPPLVLPNTGDVWLYSTPILHCSEAARDPAHRRVLQVDFAAGELPGGLTWLGV